LIVFPRDSRVLSHIAPECVFHDQFTVYIAILECFYGNSWVDVVWKLFKWTCRNCWATSERSIVFLVLCFFVSFSRQDVEDACMHAEGGGIELRELCDFLLALTDILLGKHRIKHDKEMLFIASKISFPGLTWPLRGYTFANIIFY